MKIKKTYLDLIGFQGCQEKSPVEQKRVDVMATEIPVSHGPL